MLSSIGSICKNKNIKNRWNWVEVHLYEAITNI